MGINNWRADKAEGTSAESKNSKKSTGFENVKIFIADKLHFVAETLGEKATNPDAHYGMVQYGKQVSEWLHQSAEYVRIFDYEQADIWFREYVGKRPGLSLLRRKKIAGKKLKEDKGAVIHVEPEGPRESSNVIDLMEILKQRFKESEDKKSKQIPAE